MTESTGLHETLKCMICLDFADQAVETTCCHHVGCQNCMKPIKNCPTCQKKDVLVQPAILARRVISNLPAVCPNEKCGATTTKGELEAHLKICKLQLIKCPLDECDMNAEKEELAKHILETHPERALQYISTGLEAATLTNAECFLSPCKKGVLQQDFWKHLQECHAEEMGVKPFLFVKNRAGIRAQMGSNGKFYCGKADVVYSFLTRVTFGGLEFYDFKRNTKCDCNWNCTDCMELDLILRGLKSSIPLKLINSEGRVCQTDACVHISGSFSGAQEATVPLICGKICYRDPIFYCDKAYEYGTDNRKVYCSKGDSNSKGKICRSCVEIGKLQPLMYTSVWNK